MDFFKAYDVRGVVPDELNAEMAYKIGLAYQSEFKCKTVCVGYDIRLSSKELSDSLMAGLIAGGATVYNLKICGTEEVYFHTFHNNYDGGIMVTASHNPMNYNGMKFVREEARPISKDTGLFAIRNRIIANDFIKSSSEGCVVELDNRSDYIAKMLSSVQPEDLSKLKILANPGNGCAGPVVKKIAQELPCEFEYLYDEPDGTFPNGIPNPLLPDRREATAKAVVKSGADLGLAWDGDFDRCFFYDENGRFIEGYYIVGLLAKSLLIKHHGAKILHDTRLTWNTIKVVREGGGIPIEYKTGHAFMKQKMRDEDALYGGEMSAHHYFKEFSYCDSGMIPWLLVVDLLSKSGKKLSELVDDMIAEFPISGEINSLLADPKAAIKAVEDRFLKDSISVNYLDGLSLDMGAWRFNLRCSNTEPVVRLNVESKGDEDLMKEKTSEILEILSNYK